MNNPEPAGPNILTISAVNAVPSKILVSGHLMIFLDADYGSSVNFRQQIINMNMKWILYSSAKKINNLVFERIYNLKSNQPRGKCNCSLSENHQGQHEQDKPSPNLKYSQGISGFRWDENATFHPYDNTKYRVRSFIVANGIIVLILKTVMT